MNEIDDFLARQVTPVLQPLSYRKSAHTYRKQYPNGDWAVFGFRSFPVGVLGSFLVDAAFVPEPLFDRFCFAAPALASKAPTANWINWANPITSPAETGDWEYDTDAERTARAAELAERLTAAASLMDALGADPDILVDAALRPGTNRFPELSWLDRNLWRPEWRAAVLIRRGPSAELDAAIAEADSYPTLRLREWAADYAARMS